MSSSIWEFYEKVIGTFMAKCILCKKDYSYKTSITNLKKHLRHKHLRSYQLLNSKQKLCRTPINKAPISVQFLEEDTSQSSIISPNGSQIKLEPEKPRKSDETKRKTIDEGKKKNIYESRKKIIDEMGYKNIDENRKKIIDKKLLRMITHDYQPFSIVEDENFRGFVEALNPSYELPNRKLISDTYVPDLYMDCKNKIFQLVQQATNVCLTTDCWTSSVMDSYLAVTAHILVDFELKTVLLHCEQFNCSPTAEALAVALTNVASEWQIMNKITLIVSNDVENNLTNAIERIGWPHFGCVLHKLNLVIEKSLKTIEFILLKVKKIVSHFKKSNLATETLIKYQIDVEKKSQNSALRLVQSVPTRWNSVFYMLERFLKLREALQAITPKLKAGLPIITAEMWEAIKEITMILKPFEEVTRVMSGMNYLTGSLGIVIIEGLKNVLALLKTKPIYGSAQDFLISLEKEINAYFPKTDIADNMLLGICTFLDPRFKIHAFMNSTGIGEVTPNEEASQWRSNLIINNVLEILETKLKGKHDISQAACLSRSLSPVEEEESFSIWGNIDKTIAAVTVVDVGVKAKNELEMFLNEEVVQRDSCPLAWWKNHAYKYPNLGEIFHEYGNIVISSVECKQVFSKAGELITHKRAQLSRKHTAEIVFIKSNQFYCE